MYCIKCGTKNLDTSNFCVRCGKALDKSVLVKKVQKKDKRHVDVKTSTNNIIKENLQFIEKNDCLKKSYIDSDLLPQDILLLSYAEYYYETKEDYPKFWYYEYGIKNVKERLSYLLYNDFLEFGTLFESINLYTLTDIKDVLREHGFNTSGKKREIVERLAKNINAEKLKNIYTKKPYKLTDLGKNILQRREYIRYIHNKHTKTGCSIHEADVIAKKLNTNDKYVILLHFLSIKNIEYAKKKLYGGLSSNCLAIGDVYDDMKNYLEALKFYLFAFYIDINGWNNNIDLYRDSKKEALNFALSTSVILKIKKFIKLTSCDFEQTYKSLVYITKNFNAPNPYHSKKKVVEILY